MKKLISLFLCVLMIFAVSISTSAEQTRKLEEELLKTLKNCESDDKVEITVCFNSPELTIEDMPSWPDEPEISKNQYKNYEKGSYVNYFNEIFDDIEYELNYFFNWLGICSVEVKAEYVEKIASFDSVDYISTYVWYPVSENDSIYKNTFIEQFGLTSINEYSEMYYHFDDTRAIDWVLVQAEKDDYFSLDFVEVVVNDALVSTYVSSPFYLSYGIYDVEQNKFIDLYDIKDDCSKYEGLTEFLYEQNGITQIGDVNNDLSIDIMDATLIQRCIAKLEKIVYNKIISDYDRDGKVNICDVTSIQFFLARM